MCNNNFTTKNIYSSSYIYLIIDFNVIIRATKNMYILLAYICNYFFSNMQNVCILNLINIQKNCIEILFIVKSQILFLL